MNDPLDRLGRWVADVESAEADTSEELALGIQRVRYRIGDAIEEERKKFPRRIALFGGVGFTALVVVAGLIWLEPDGGDRLRVYADADSVELTGATIGSAAGTKQLRFTDGTRLSLYPETLMDVVATTERGATLRLGKGRTLASIIPRRDGKWRLEAGPYVIRVTGTEFELAWDPDEAQIELAMHRGSVILTGPNVPGELVVQGSEFVRFSTGAAAPEERERFEPATFEEADPRPALTEEEWDLSSRSSSSTKKASPAEDSTLRTAQQLWHMVKEHRKAGDGRAARSVLLELRSRHGARGQTAYLLGRVHADLLGSTSEAVHWFEMYLKESPGGSLSEQALGRLMELQSGTAAGRATAQRYLRSYPDGFYAGLARSSLR